ncbi:bifunctional uridylate/adenylate kinase [Pestalotiopsis sp. IQ-011]
MAATSPMRIDAPSSTAGAPQVNGFSDGAARKFNNFNIKVNGTMSNGQRAGGGSASPGMQPSHPPALPPHTQPAPAMGPGSPVVSTPTSTQSPPAFPAAAVRDRMPSTHNGKIAIVEPPAQAPNISHRSSGSASSGFPSPIREHQPIKPKFHEDQSRLTNAVQQAVPEAVRRVVRDNWEKALLGTDFHSAFVLNAAIHHASGPIARRAVKDFGSKMVGATKVELLQHFTAKDLDEVADLILDKASEAFFDKALERRLSTIDARSLINALARAERLGYEDNDTLDEKPGPPPSTGAPAGLDLPYEQPVQNAQPSPPVPGFEYFCEHCGAGFITNVGQQYHHANKVCGDHGMAAATPKPNLPVVTTYNANTQTLTPVPAPLPRPGLSGTIPAQPSFSQPTPGPLPKHHQQQPVTTPVSQGQKRTYTPQSQSTPGAPPSSGAGAMSIDPYAHLTPEERANLEAELRAAEETIAPRFKEADEIQDPAARAQKLDSLKNVFSTRQSLIRKRYGVRLRVRRSQYEIDAQNARLVELANTPSAKRQRTDPGDAIDQNFNSIGRIKKDDPGHPETIQQSVGAATASSPMDHIPVAGMNASGLGASAATAATVDPTGPSPAAVLPPARSLSSMQRSGYRISTHTSRHSSPTPDPEDSAARPASPGLKLENNQRQSPEMKSGTAAEPVVLDEDSDSTDSSSESGSDTESDEDIPAHAHPGQNRTVINP